MQVENLTKMLVIPHDLKTKVWVQNPENRKGSDEHPKLSFSTPGGLSLGVEVKKR